MTYCIFVVTTINVGLTRSMYEERTYREWVRADGLVMSRVCQAESDLCILAPQNVTSLAEELLKEVRWDLDRYIGRDERFLTSRTSYQPLHDAPQLISKMSDACNCYGIGPMAAVAGAVADWVGSQLADKVGQVVVENGGDIFACTDRPLTFGIFAGKSSPFSGKLKFTTSQSGKPLGVCTSSGTVGHSYSRGKADVVCVVAGTATLADAAATAYCNQIQRADDIQRILDMSEKDPNVEGLLVTLGSHLGVWGCIRLV